MCSNIDKNCQNIGILHSKFTRVVPQLNPFKSEFTIVTFIHYKPRIAVAILDL